MMNDRQFRRGVPSRSVEASGKTVDEAIQSALRGDSMSAGKTSRSKSWMRAAAVFWGSVRARRGFARV